MFLFSFLKRNRLSIEDFPRHLDHVLLKGYIKGTIIEVLILKSVFIFMCLSFVVICVRYLQKGCFLR